MDYERTILVYFMKECGMLCPVMQAVKKLWASYFVYERNICFDIALINNALLKENKMTIL